MPSAKGVKKPRKKEVSRTCPVCDKLFIAKSWNAKFCSKRCQKQHFRELDRLKLAKKNKKKKPTARQKKAFELIIKNGGNVSKGMRDAGYPKTTAKNPSKLRRSKAWADLMEEYIPENLVAKTHQRQLKAKHYVTVDGISKQVDDNLAQNKAMDLAYKLRGKYAAEQINITRRKYSDLSNEELIAKKKKLSDFLSKK